MKANLLKINAYNPELRKIKKVVECLNSGGLVIYPTDTVYGLGCDFKNKKALERLCKVKGIKGRKLDLSLMFSDLSDISTYAFIDRAIYRQLNEYLPGPYTFILPASNAIPKIQNQRKKEVGIRVPNNNIVRVIVEELGYPIINTSLKNDDEIINYYTDPEEIFEDYKHLVDLIVDGGTGQNRGSTIISYVNGEEGEMTVLRHGLNQN